MSAGSFRDHVGRCARVDSVDQQWLLAEVVERDPTSFSLLFEGEAEPIVAQGTYSFRWSDGETAEIFVVPLGPGANGNPVYEAVFNTTRPS